MSASDLPRATLRRRRWALALVSSFIGLLAVEMFARWRFGSPLAERTPILFVEAHPTRGFAMVPDQVHYTYRHRTQTNSLGLRHRELGPKAEGEWRVLLLGDSLVYGQGVADQDTLSRLVEDRLAPDFERRGLRPEVINAGLRAYDTRQELALLEELGDRLEPDLVVLGWYLNDFQESPIEQNYPFLREHGPVAFDTRGPMTGWDGWSWRLRQVPRASAFLMWLWEVRKAYLAEEPPPGYLEAGLARLDGFLERFEQWCREREVAFAVVVLPDPGAVMGQPFALEAQEAVVRLARSRGLAAADLTPAVAAHVAAGNRLPILPYDGHWNPTGNRLIADALTEFLTTSNLLR